LNLSDVVDVVNKDELLEIIANNKRVVINFGALAWCVPCQRFEPHYERAAGQLNDVKFVRVDVDSADWAMVDFGVKSVPTVKLYENGTYVRDIKAPQGALPFMRELS
jgi:thioredoxin 1